MAARRLVTPDQPAFVRAVLTVYEFLSSLKFAVVLIALLAIVLGLGTFVESAYGTEAVKFGVDFLGEIPLDIKIRETSDAGTPIVASEPTSPHSLAYGEIAAKIWNKLEKTPQRVAPRIVLK